MLATEDTPLKGGLSLLTQSLMHLAVSTSCCSEVSSSAERRPRCSTSSQAQRMGLRDCPTPLPHEQHRVFLL